MSVIKLAIDMGTSSTKIYELGSGVVLMEPSAVAVGIEDDNLRAVGADAKKMLGKTAENTSVIFPVREGLIADERAAVLMLDNYLKKIQAKGLFKRVEAVVPVSCGISDVEIYKFAKVLRAVGIKKTEFLEVPICCALGMNAPLTEFNPCFSIDMGGGCTNVAALSLDGIIAGLSVNMGGCNMDSQLIDFIAYNYNLKIGLQTAERMKVQIAGLQSDDATSAVVNGRDTSTGRPRSISLKSSDLYEVVRSYYDKVVDVSWKVMKKLPAEVSAEIRHAGLYITGGGSKIAGLCGYMSEKLDMEVNLAEDADTACVMGAGIIAGSSSLLQRLKIEKKF